MYLCSTFLLKSIISELSNSISFSMHNPFIKPHNRAEDELIPDPDGSVDFISQLKLIRSLKIVKVINQQFRNNSELLIVVLFVSFDGS